MTFSTTLTIVTVNQIYHTRTCSPPKPNSPWSNCQVSILLILKSYSWNQNKTNLKQFNFFEVSPYCFLQWLRYSVFPPTVQNGSPVSTSSPALVCWLQPKCLSVDEWIKRLWDTYAMEYYLAIKKKKILPFVPAWMDLESIMLSETSHLPYHMISLMWTLMNKLN